MKSFILGVLCSVLLIFSGATAHASEALKSLPVQDNGRVKPFDTFAKEVLQLIYGRETMKDAQGNKKSAANVVFTWLIVPDMWVNQKIIQVRHSGLREALQLEDQKEIHHSLSELLANPNLALLVKDKQSKQDKKLKLNPYDQAVQTLENQIGRMNSIVRGHSPMIIPVSKNWEPVVQLKAQQLESFVEIKKNFVSYLTSKAEGKEDSSVLDASINQFVALLKEQYGEDYAPFKTIRYERHYKELKPFQWAWVLYFVSAIFLMFFIFSKKAIYSKISYGLMFVAMGLHLYGFLLRVFITGRAPVTSMYETVAWVPFVALVCSIIIARVYKIAFVQVMGLVASVFCLMLSDLSPVVLDPSLRPLEPVLRDNFWLLTHVLMIVSSYGAFMLAFFIGDLVLFYFLRGKDKYKVQINQGVQAIYRSVQVGVVLLAGGTILGGVWADYSWGRFWGWDPKETWAFIALVGYLILLHGRLAGWFRNLGMAVGGVVCFSLVIMAWYGVNFVLGAGLHSYGFGAGGVEYVSVFVALHLIFAVYVLVYTKLSKK